MPEPLVKNWELYSSSMKCGQATRALNAAMTLAAKKLIAGFKRQKLHEDDDEGIGRLIAGLRDKVLYPVMKKYSKYGATDTEPRFHAGQGLINAAKDYFGVPRCANREEWGDYL